MSLQLQKSHTNKLLLLAGAVVLAILSRNIGIFWDNTLSVSKTGTFLLNNGIFHWILPDSIDAGHQPFIGSYMALVWKIFGKYLIVGWGYSKAFCIWLIENKNL